MNGIVREHNSEHGFPLAVRASSDKIEPV